VRIVLQSGADAQRVAAPEAYDVPVILSTVFALPPREDEFHAYPYQTPGVLAKAGVAFAFSSGGSVPRDVPSGRPRHRWGSAGCGHPRAHLDAAKILGVDRGRQHERASSRTSCGQGDPEVRSQIRRSSLDATPLDTKHRAYKR
jgi:hypothetical protein